MIWYILRFYIHFKTDFLYVKGLFIKNMKTYIAYYINTDEYIVLMDPFEKKEDAYKALSSVLFEKYEYQKSLFSI